jgi:hypothetical protein
MPIHWCQYGLECLDKAKVREAVESIWYTPIPEEAGGEQVLADVGLYDNPETEYRIHFDFGRGFVIVERSPYTRSGELVCPSISDGFYGGKWTWYALEDSWFVPAYLLAK